MSPVIKILQLGKRDWNSCYQIPKDIKVIFEKISEKDLKKGFDLVFIERNITIEESILLKKLIKAYTLFVPDCVEMDEVLQELCIYKKGKRINKEEIQSFIQNEAKNYFPKPYGEKFQLNKMAVSQDFKGKIKWNGNCSVELDGNFGDHFCQVAFWRNNIPLFENQAIDLWLEYKKSGSVEIKLYITQFAYGSLSTVQNIWEFSEEDLKDLVVLDNSKNNGPLFVSLHAKGAGKLEIVALHDRISRRGHGNFLPGGERYVSLNREEVFAYFDPGDMKPPLNVYFSGYKTQQGFEGYFMMRRMGGPFLLIAEPRLEGGSFYMGDEEYEAIIPNIIRKYMDELGFDSKQVVMSGLSMGTYGALYYGCDILPHAIILGKPLASIGDVAVNERLHRPGGFPTSLDVLKYIGGDLTEDAVHRLNQRFWDKFDATKWDMTKFAIAYMIEDDYDSTAYQKLLNHVSSEGIRVYGKGIHGRHNDDSPAIVNWFVNQYNQILLEDFGRKKD